ncbi:MAG: hypothetical protein ACKVU1_07330 [bacterium]
MLARRFFYVSLGILALSIAYHLGVNRAEAEWNQNASGQIVGFVGDGGGGGLAITSSGEAWRVEPTVGWTRTPGGDLPQEILASEVAFFDGSASGGYVIVTSSDEVWVNYGSPWRSVGALPGGTNATEATSWGKLKGSFR